MRILVTGASGLIGKQLIPLLSDLGCELLLVGRNKQKLDADFPDFRTTTYDDLWGMANGYDTLLHLAVMNNDHVADLEDFLHVNAELTADLCKDAKTHGISTFIFVSSTHTLDRNNMSSYAVSKRKAAEHLAEIRGIRKFVLYLPAVVGDKLGGKLAIVERLPRIFQNKTLMLLKSLKPTVHVSHLADTIVSTYHQHENEFQEFIVTEGQRDNPVFSKTKRFVDLAFALFVIALLWWAMIAIWVAIKLHSPGPGVFRQLRVGRNEKIFTCLKFRTMYLSAPNVGTHEVPAASVTPVGHFLRRTKLDELPQVFNILRNEMSLVGPRPCLPTQFDMIAERRSQGVFGIKPGITGLAQIRGIDMSEPSALARCDREYLQLQSVILDAKIIVQTAIGAGSGDKILSNMK